MLCADDCGRFWGYQGGLDSLPIFRELWASGRENATPGEQAASGQCWGEEAYSSIWEVGQGCGKNDVWLSKQALPVLDFYFEPASCPEKRVGEIFPF